MNLNPAASETASNLLIEPVLVVSQQKLTDFLASLGQPEYSYSFVLSIFRDSLAKFGTIVTVDDPLKEVDAVYDLCQHFGLRCLYLCFEPPHKLPRNLRCPAVPVFAWEFADIPQQTWDENPYNDWRIALRKTGRAITHSNYAAHVVRKAMGEHYPVAVCPAPVWDQYQNIPPPKPHQPRRLELPSYAVVLDTGKQFTAPANPNAGYSASVALNIEEVLSGGEKPSEVQSFDLDGVVYCTVLNPGDGRKRCWALLQTFCVAFRDQPSATLIIKFIDSDEYKPTAQLSRMLATLTPMRCRVIGISSYLDQSAYRNLVAVSDFCVNASTGEGQCLPLMEFLSAGRPAVAPFHTGMMDYLDSSIGFEVATTRAPASLPHDPRHKIVTYYQVPDYGSYEEALKRSYQCATEDSALYQKMMSAAREKMQHHCSRAVVETKLAELLLSSTPFEVPEPLSLTPANMTQES